jgi:transcriptional regulator with XRE-family HTH domain
MIGARLRLGRIANSLSLQDLADILTEMGEPITKAGLSKYETDKVIPNDKMLGKIAQIMDLDVSFFFKDDYPDYHISTARAYEALPKQAAEFDAFLQITLEQHFEIDQLLGCLQTSRLPDPIKVKAGDDAVVEAFVQNLRQLWHVSEQPISSVVELLEDNGFYVFELPESFGISCIAGTVIENGHPFLGYTRQQFVDDIRLYILRELGYLFIHCDDEDTHAHMSRLFARSFLLPSKRLIEDVGDDYHTPTFWELTILKQKYGISKYEIRHRLKDVGLVQKDAAVENMRKKNYSPARRKLDSSREVLNFSESPVRFRLKVLLAYKKKLITNSEAAALLPSQYIQLS